MGMVNAPHPSPLPPGKALKASPPPHRACKDDASVADNPHSAVAKVGDLHLAVGLHHRDADLHRAYRKAGSRNSEKKRVM